MRWRPVKPRAWHFPGLKAQIHLFRCGNKNGERDEDLHPFFHFLLEEALLVAGTLFGALSSEGCCSALCSFHLSIMVSPEWLCWHRLERVHWQPKDCLERQRVPCSS